jgi:hypothetical protein
MNRIVRYFELGESGERTGRQLIIKDHTPKPPPADGAQWRLDPDFNAGDELLESSGFREVLASALKNGHQVIS